MAQGTQAAPFSVRVTGRVDSVTRREGEGGKVYFLTRVKAPAPDPYSHPSLCEVVSPAKFAAVGEEVDVPCTLRGYRRKGKTADGRDFDKVDHALVAA